jgi:ribosome-associated protein
LTSQDQRSLSQNQDVVVARLLTLVTEALAPPPPTRRATRPSRSKQRARLDDKTRRGGVKRLRQAPSED